MDKHYEITSSFSKENSYFTTLDKKTHSFCENSNPYQYLLGSLSGCFYSTLSDITQKMGLSYEKIEISLNCTKRKEEPTTMDKCIMNLSVYNVSDNSLFCQAIDKCCDTCSIYYTLNQVAQITLEVDFL